MYSHTLSEILKGPWMVAPQLADAWLPTISKWLKGNANESTPENPIKKELRGYYMDESGNRLDHYDIDTTTDDLIGVIEINGPMIKTGNAWCYGANELVAIAQAFENDPKVIGHLWKIDTGGGSVNAIPLYLDFHATRQKPLISLCDMCASAGMYIAAPSDRLYAENDLSAMFGSVGVTTTLYDYSDYLKNEGVAEHVINAIQSTHKNTSYYKARGGDYKDFQDEHLNPLAEKFIADMQKFRPSIQADIDGILAGKMFYANNAEAYGLIDGVRSHQQVVQELKTMATKNVANQFMFN